MSTTTRLPHLVRAAAMAVAGLGLGMAALGLALEAGPNARSA